MKNTPKNMDMDLLANQVRTLMPDGGEKTTRTTFTLPKATHDLITNLTVKKRSKCKVFDNVIDAWFQDKNIKSSFLGFVEKEFSDNTKDWELKTYTISVKAKKHFDELAKEMNVARDILINSIIKQHNALTEISKAQEVKKVEEASKILDEFQPLVEENKNKLDALLGVDHPITQMFGQVNASLENCRMAIDRHLKTGEPIDPQLSI
ncbi:MAG: hypothetical protein ISR95_00200 [Candidatus Marinimicrobia bacterium]|nr:hypothetical protein [Candidatus Neomarinimicrobiota bacterium]MBL7046051.1 hypothetical protein [Candidatus Neomarinimicrobiota bacterium]